MSEEDKDLDVDIVPEPEPEEDKKDKRARIQTQPKTSKQFFRARAKNPKLYTFTRDGNLSVPELPGQPATTLTLPYYRNPTATEIQAYDQERYSELAAIEAAYDKAMSELRQAMEDWRSTGRTSTVLELQMRLRTLDAQRTALRSPQRWTKVYSNPVKRTILFDNRYEVRKIGHDAYAYKPQTYPYSLLQKESEENPRAKGVEEEEEGDASVTPPMGPAGVPSLFIYKADDPTTGALSMYSLLTFEYGTERYPSIAHAYEAQRLKEFGKFNIYDKILKKQKDPMLMRQKARAVVGAPSDPMALLLLIIRAASRRKPFAEALRATGTAPLLFAEPEETVLGVGLAANDVRIENPANWTGPNLYGKALEMVRKEIPKGALVDIVMEGGAIEELSENTRDTEKKRYFIGLHQRKANMKNPPKGGF